MKNISYYDLILLVKTKKQPNKILLQIDENRELLFEFNLKYNIYYIVPTKESLSFYEEYESYLNLNITEDDFFKENIKVISPYLFSVGEYVSYFDLINAIKLNTQPYKVRIHIDSLQHDYIFDSVDSSYPKTYIEFEDDGSIPTWDFELSNQISDNNWFIKNIEIIEVNNELNN